MLNMINFLVFRVTRGVLFALETCMAPDDAMKVGVPQVAFTTIVMCQVTIATLQG